MDRQLEEALTHGPDALHLAAVFGISERAANRYANAAKAFLDCAGAVRFVDPNRLGQAIS